MTHTRSQPALTDDTCASSAAECLFELSLDLLCVVGADGMFRRVNPAFERTLGWTDEDFLTHPLFAYVHPDDREHCAAEWPRMIASGGVRTFEFRFRCRDGSYRCLEWHGSPTDEDGLVYAVARDVTERRESEARLRFQSDLLQALGQAIIGTNVDGTITYWGRGAEALYGWREEEVLGRNVNEVTPADLTREQAEAITRCVAEGKGWSGEFLLQRRDGTTFTGLVSTTPIRDESGAVIGLVGVSADLSEQKRSEAALKQGESYFRTLSASSPIGIFQSDRDGSITYANPRVLQIFALSEAEGLGHGWICRVHPEDVDEVVTGWANALREGREYTHEYRLRLPNGEIRWVNCRAAPTTDASGALAGTVGSVEDTTERRTLEARLRQAQKMEAVGQLAGGVAHDFNNLLTVIQSYGTFVAADLPEGSTLHADVSEILNAARRAADLTRQLLAFGRKQVLQPRRLDLNQHVTNIVGMLRRLIGEDIALETQLAGALCPVSADPGQLEQVLMNLAVNARDAMPNGGTLRLRTQNVQIDADAARERPGLRPGAYSSIVVEDTGCGIDAAALPHIFEPFYTTKGPGHGTGLGLATVYGIVKQSDGYISVDSTLGVGTRFTVLLPRADAPVAETGQAPAPVPRGTETILLVEDEIAVRAVIRRMLETLGYTVLDALDGRDALRLAAEHTGCVDLLLTDVVMPEMNGRALAEQLAERWPRLRVLFMSGYTDDEILRRGLAQSGSSFLEKPFTPERVAGAIRRALDGTTASDGGQV